MFRNGWKKTKLIGGKITPEEFEKDFLKILNNKDILQEAINSIESYEKENPSSTPLTTEELLSKTD